MKSLIPLEQSLSLYNTLRSSCCMLNTSASDDLQSLALQTLAQAVRKLCRHCLNCHTSCEPACEMLQMLYQRFVPHTLANLVTRMLLTACMQEGPVLPHSIQNLCHVVCAILHPAVTELGLLSATLHVLESQKFPVLSNLRVLELSGMHYRTSPRARASLRGLTHLETIVYHHHCTDDFLIDLAACCEQLRRLYIRGSVGVTLRSAPAVRELLSKGLQDLDIAWTKLNMVEMFLATRPSSMKHSVPPAQYLLKKLGISSVKAGDINTVQVKGFFPHLEKLSVSALCADASLQANKLSNLVSLELIHCILSPDLLLHVGPQLCELRLIAATELDVGRLTRICGVHLKHLTLSSCRHVQYNEDLKNCQIRDQFHTLHFLQLDSLFPKEDTCILLYCAATVQVITVSLDDPHEVQTFIEALPRLPNLQEFSLRSHWGRGLLTLSLVKRMLDLCPNVAVLKGINHDVNIAALRLNYPDIAFQH